MINELKSNGKWKEKAGQVASEIKGNGEERKEENWEEIRQEEATGKTRGKRSCSGDTKRFTILSVLHFESCVGLAF